MAMSVAADSSGRPVSGPRLAVRVVRGQPSAEEVAALSTALLLLVSRRDNRKRPERSSRPRWPATADRYRPPCDWQSPTQD